MRRGRCRGARKSATSRRTRSCFTTRCAPISCGRDPTPLKANCATRCGGQRLTSLSHGFPQDLDTIVGDRGATLSQGERQRLALARALLRQPRLLVLDESTNSLDSENETRILSAIERIHGGITTVLIAHRLSTIRWADLIYVIEDGRVVESGDWTTLAAKLDGRFRSWCVAQGLAA